jgi:hypothetical protein
MTPRALLLDAASPPRAAGAWEWAGAGDVVFIGHSGGARPGALRRFGGPAQAASGFGSGGSGALRQALEDFFSHGGRAAWTFEVEDLDHLTREGAGALLGDDGGPGYRSGLQSVADLECAGILAAPGGHRDEVHDALIGLALRQPSLFVVLESGAEEPLRRGLAESLDRLRAESERLGRGDPRERIGWAPAARGPGALSLGARLGLLAGADHPFDAASAARRLPAEVDIPTIGGGLASLRAWRRWEGLRRSLDLGSRWVLFEAHHPALAARLAREARAFLLRLLDAGFFAARAPEEAFEVRCLESSLEPSRGLTAKLSLEVAVRLRAPSA